MPCRKSMQSSRPKWSRSPRPTRVPSPIQRGTSTTWNGHSRTRQPSRGLCSGRSTSRMANSPTCLRCSRMWTSSARIRPSARSDPLRRTRSLRCTHTPLPPRWSPSHPHARKSSTPETGGRTEQRSVSGSSGSMGGSIRSRNQDKGLVLVPSTETPPSPESPPATKAGKHSKRQRFGRSLGVRIGHYTIIYTPR